MLKGERFSVAGERFSGREIQWERDSVLKGERFSVERGEIQC